MRRAYILTNFYLDTDIDLGYLFEKRYIKYSKSEILDNIKEISEEIYEEYRDKTGVDLSFDEFYNKFKFTVEISSINLNHRPISNINDYNTYLLEVDSIVKKDLVDYLYFEGYNFDYNQNLEEYLLDYIDDCRFEYDHNLNLLETYTNITQMLNQFSFSYKALFPDKYHVEKYKIGDKVLYNNEEYIIKRIMNPGYSIFKSLDPLNYLYGYVLGTEDGYVLNDDRFCYFPVDEDLIPIV